MTIYKSLIDNQLLLQYQQYRPFADRYYVNFYTGKRVQIKDKNVCAVAYA